MTRIAISPVTAVTCNDAFEVIEDAALHIEGNRITYAGARAAAPPFEADEIIGGAQFVALPGLVNTHTHAAMTLLRGYADDMALEPWLHEKIWPFEAHLNAEDVYHGTRLAIIEMLLSGTTALCDMYHFYEEGTRAYIESGLRACPSAVLLGFLPDAQQKIEKGIAFVQEYSGAGQGRITPFFGPHSLYTCGPEHWKSIVEAAHALNVPITTHAAETCRAVEIITQTWGASPIQTLHNIGALEGPLLAAHCVHTDAADRALMQQRDENGDTFLRVLHNPTSNLKLASGFAPVPQYLSENITVGLGTDGTASNNDLDMWEEMRLAALLHKATTGDPTVVSAQQALLMATREGAKCLNLQNDIGTLETGQKADIVLMDFDKPHLTPRHNVVSHLVYAARASDVDTVLVDGRVLVRGGELTKMDAEAVCAQAEKRAARLVEKAGGQV
jgi:5-methylthioadenosine/S-adenosylhomocysteine deaminase